MMRAKDDNKGHCPYCGLYSVDKQNEVTVLNTITNESLVECACGERYFVIYVEDE